MKEKIKVGVLFGGKSAEHEISIKSAKNILDSLDQTLYKPILISVDKTGKWFASAGDIKTDSFLDIEDLKHQPSTKQLLFVPGETKHQLKPVDANVALENIDVILPIIHGPYGEDGSVQGLLKLANIPFAGPSVLGSAVGMDKDVMKRLLQDANIKTARYQCFNTGNKTEISYETIKDELGIPLFIKPANLGSSVGISKADTAEEFLAAVELAFKYDRKIIIEEMILGRELECALIGNEVVEASVPGELLGLSDDHEFYSYEAKYLDENGSAIQIPAKLETDELAKVQAIAIKTYQALCCEGLARVDVFLTQKGEIFVNEINTLPGFTSISMYPKLWEASGKSYSNLLTELINLAIDRSEQEQKLLTSL